MRLVRNFLGRFGPGILLGVVSTLVIGGLLGFLLSPELLKHRSPFPLEESLGELRIEAAIGSDYKDKANPVVVNNDSLTAGRSAYLANCSFCHGTTGLGDAKIGQNLYPPAANLTQQKTLTKTDGQLYWILQHGLSFVGMPAWTDVLSDQQMWSVVIYVRALQKQATTGQPVAIALPATVAPTSQPAAQTSTDPAAVQAGLQLFQTNGCSGCHLQNGTAAGGVGPKLQGDPQTTSSTFIKDWVRNNAIAPMPKFPVSQLPDADLEKIVAYLQSLH